MKFRKVTPNENYSKLRFLSEDDKYEIGLSPVIFGVRVRGGRKGSLFCDIDYCAGDDPMFQLMLLATMIQILEKVPADTESGMICKILPSYEIKPINLDPCWEKLQELANLPVDEFLKVLNNE